MKKFREKNSAAFTEISENFVNHSGFLYSDDKNIAVININNVTEGFSIVRLLAQSLSKLGMNILVINLVHSNSVSIRKIDENKVVIYDSEGIDCIDIPKASHPVEAISLFNKNNQLEKSLSDYDIQIFYFPSNIFEEMPRLLKEYNYTFVLAKKGIQREKINLINHVKKEQKVKYLGYLQLKN